MFNLMRSTPNTYYLLVIVDKVHDKIVGVGSVFMERKFLRGLGVVGHIEDIAVDKNMQGHKLGLRIIQALTAISEGQGAYKTILNCSTDNIRKYLCFARKEIGPGSDATPLKLSTRSVDTRRRSMKW